MSTMSTASTPFARRFVSFVAAPLLFIAGVQLFVLSEQTDVYFAWTIALPFTAAFMGAGYWAALIAAYTSMRQATSIALRVVGPASIAATVLLGVATFLHLDKFHLAAPALLTRFVTWVWIIVYVVTPLVFLVLWLRQGLARDASMGAHPIPGWMRIGYLVQAGLVLIAGILLFVIPAGISPLWPWSLTPLTARAVGAWLTAYGLACVTIYRENDLPNTAGTRASLLAFCLLQFVVLARYFSSFDLTKPLAWLYLLVLLVGVIVGGAGLFNRST